MKCKKCENSGTVVLRRKDRYCEMCFITNVNHKFRSCIGKNRAMPPNENVLICLSGGMSSTVLLDMIYHAISLSNHKKLRISPFFLHLLDSSNNVQPHQAASAVIEQCKQYDFNVHMVHMSVYIQEHTELPEAYIIPANNNETEFNVMLKNMPNTVKNDFIMKIRRNLFVRIAEQLKCNYVFTAETTATLAISLLSNLAVGRGALVQDDVSFCDVRDDKIKIIRPMKDISKDELLYYTRIKKLNPLDQSIFKEHSLQSVIKAFVMDLQDSFEATISTVCKTADKMGTNDEAVLNLKCVLCKSHLRKKSATMTAFEATNFSRTVSLERPNSIDETNIFNQESDSDAKSMFPFLNTHLCYGCSRNYLEMDHGTLPNYIRKALDG